MRDTNQFAQAISYNDIINCLCPETSADDSVCSADDDDTSCEQPLQDEESTVGFNLREASAHPILNAETERQLITKLRQTNNPAEKKEIRDELVNHNIRLVGHVAHQLCRSGSAIVTEDLIQEGLLGLIDAIDRFDPDKGTKLSTYATWYIAKYIRNYLKSENSILSTTHNADDKIAKIYHAMYSYANKHNGEFPPINILATQIGIPESEINKLINIYAQPIPLDATYFEDNLITTYADLIPDDKAVQPASELIQTDISTIIYNELQHMSAQTRHILELKYGFIDGDERTLEVIGQEFGITRERIRQIISKEFQKIRCKKPKRRDMLHSLLEEA